MSLPNNSLEDRLNAVKEGKDVPTPENYNFNINSAKNNSVEDNNINIKNHVIIESYKILNILSTSILYGYGIKALSFQDWNFIECFGIGFILNHIISFTLKYKSIKNNKK